MYKGILSKDIIYEMRIYALAHATNKNIGK